MQFKFHVRLACSFARLFFVVKVQIAIRIIPVELKKCALHCCGRLHLCDEVALGATNVLIVPDILLRLSRQFQFNLVANIPPITIFPGGKSSLCESKKKYIHQIRNMTKFRSLFVFTHFDVHFCI